MADPFDPTSSANVTDSSGNASPDFWRNLATFGASVSAAANARTGNGFLQYGPGLAGPLGAGFLGAQEQSRDNARTRAQVGYTQANTGLVGAEAQSKRFQNQQMLTQTNFQRGLMGLGPLDINGQPTGAGPSGAPQSPQGQSDKSSYPVGMVSSPSAGMPSAPQSTDNTRAVPRNGGPAPPQATAASNAPGSSLGGIPLAVWQGQQAPSPQQAGMMANMYDMYGQPDKAKQYREYSMSPKDGMRTNPDYSQSYVPGGQADPRYKASVASAEGWAKSDPDLYVKRNSPSDLRQGGVRYDPTTGQYVQVEERVTGVDPATGAHFLQPAPLGVVTGNVNGGSPQPSGPQGPPSGGSLLNPNMIGGSGTQVAPAAGPATPPPAPPLNAPPPAPSPQAGLRGFGDGRVVQTELPPGQKEIIEGAAKNYTDEGKKTYESAVDLKGSIEYIKRDLDQLGPEGFLAAGSGADARLGFAKAVNTALQVGGFQPNWDPNKIGAWEDFKKESTLGGMRGLSAIFGGSREAASIISTSIGAFPHPENSYQGARLLVNAFDEAANHEIDKRNFETNWAQDPQHGGNLTGANEVFNQQFPAAMYTRRAISQVQPYDVPNEAAAQKRYLPGTIVRFPDKKTYFVPGEPGVTLKAGQ